MTFNYLDIGTNIIEFVNTPIWCPVSYKLLDEPNGKIDLFTIEDSNNGLILTTELRDVNKDIIAKIKKNTIEELNKDYKIEGAINNGTGFRVIRKNDGLVIFNIRTIDETIKVTGFFDFAGWELNVTDDAIYVNPGNGKVYGNYKSTMNNCGITLSLSGISC